MKKIIALCAVLVASLAIAEPASVPHTFKDDSPAVADEVNANFQSLLNVLGGMKRLYLYQNSAIVGSAISAVIVNVVKLNSSYLVMVDKPRGDSTIYLRSFFDDLYYESYDCSGATYTTETVEVDLLVGEVGAVVAVGDQAYYQDFSGTPATPTIHSALLDGSCRGPLSAYLPNFAQASTYSGGDGVCAGWTPATEYVIETSTCGDGVVDFDCSPLSRSPVCQTYDQYLEGYSNYNYGRDFFGLDETKSLYPLILNNPAVTGITTQPCTYKSERAVCLPNASLVTE